MSYKSWRAIGLMSGTSLDGLDICYCVFSQLDQKWQYEILAAETVVYSNSWKAKLANSMNLSGVELMRLDADLGVYFGERVLEFLKKESLAAPDFIASHGHTVFHQPENGLTTQIGSGAHIKAVTNVTTVCDFRTFDVALGGNGAPLVPIGDKLLFANYDACINLGGIANISFEESGVRKAFDICPFNMVLNHLIAERNLEYDNHGGIAREGKLQQSLLNALNELAYYQQARPKSLGKEWVDDVFLKTLNEFDFSMEDKLHTCVHHFVAQIAEVILDDAKQVLLTGGGAYHSFFVEELQKKMSAQVEVPNAQLIEFKEALIFAFLGVLRLENKTNVLSSVTGAKSDSCSGIVYAE